MSAAQGQRRHSTQAKIILFAQTVVIAALLVEHKNIKLVGFLLMLMGVNALIVKYNSFRVLLLWPIGVNTLALLEAALIGEPN
jgi:hypothetical protein